MSDEKDDDKEKKDARETLDVAADASTRTIKARFRAKVKALESARANVAISKKTFQELNEAYQQLIQARGSSAAAPTKTVTILSSDVAGYSRMMATNEKDTLEFFNLCKDIFEELVAENQGRVFNTAGDAILAEFEYVFNAIHCAVEIQKELRAINQGQPEDRKVLFRMGINTGPVFQQGEDLLGDAVNLAARIQTSAKPGGICVSGQIYDLVANKVTHSFTSLGKVSYKNIPEPVRTYALTEDDGKFKPPLPDPRKAQYESPAVPVPEKKKTKEPEKKSGAPVWFALAVIGVGAFFAWNTFLRDTTPAAPKVPEQAPGDVFISSAPPTQITVSQGDKNFYQATSPGAANVSLKPGHYRVRFLSRELGINDVNELDVVSGKNPYFEKSFDVKPAGEAPAAQPGAPRGNYIGLTPGNYAAFVAHEADFQAQVDQSQNRDAAYNLAILRLEKGKPEEAYDFLRISARQGHGPAQYELGKMFYSGKGSPSRDVDAAIYWLIKAGLNGVNQAGEFLGNNTFPTAYETHIKLVRQVLMNDPAAARKRDTLNGLLEDIKPQLEKNKLPD